MNDAIKTYKFLRTQCQKNAIDACTDAAQINGVDASKLALALIEQNIDVRPLGLI
jgi:hypothetical protein